MRTAKADLKLLFTGLVTQYPEIGSVFDSYWKEIVDAYSAEGRHYHTLLHLHYISQRLEECSQKAADREALLFCLFYHDIVYRVNSRTNEEESAEIARQRMAGMGVKTATIELCARHILATKTHELTGNADSNLFCDADIAILGETEAVFKEYCARVRQEYQAIPEKQYNRGRAAELQKILDMKRIYKTEFFYSKYEAAARRNLGAEIKRLSAG